MFKNQTSKLFLLGVLVPFIIVGVSVALGGLTVGKTGNNCEQVQCDTICCDSTHCDTIKCVQQ